ncbi:MAG TPA: murein biosynthesis integral membrane protein MurJ [Gemmatimonadaceae bacterium]
MTEAGTGGPPTPASGPEVNSGGRAASLVMAGVLVSRLLGLVRQRFFAFYLGTSDAADAFTAAFRIPNMLQNLLGEGVLSASLIPVYSGLKVRGDDEGRREVASAVLSLLALAVSIIVLLGILLAGPLTALIAIGYSGEKLELTTRLVRILFPGAGLLVLSAWCLGVLNAHGRFFLSYASAAFWNVAMIVTLVFYGGRSSLDELVVWLAWGSVFGCFLQLAVQWPGAKRALGAFRSRWGQHREDVSRVLRNFVPVFFGRGVTQLSGFVDTMIASLPVLGTGAQVTLNYAQLLYGVPMSLFGIAISAAELPAMSSVVGTDVEVAEALRRRMADALRRIAFFVVPSAVAFVAFGDQLAELIYGGGRFGADEARWVWGVLAGASVGLVATTLGRLYASAFYALRDTRTPLRFAMLRVATSISLGATLSVYGPRLLNIDPRWGVAGITIAAGTAGWIEFLMLRRALRRRIGMVDLAPRTLMILWGAAALAAGLALVARVINADAPMLVRVGFVLGIYGMTYWLVTWRAGIPEAVSLRARVFRRGR